MFIDPFLFLYPIQDPTFHLVIIFPWALFGCESFSDFFDDFDSFEAYWLGFVCCSLIGICLMFSSWAISFCSHFPFTSDFSSQPSHIFAVCELTLQKNFITHEFSLKVFYEFSGMVSPPWSEQLRVLQAPSKNENDQVFCLPWASNPVNFMIDLIAAPHTLYWKLF